MRDTDTDNDDDPPPDPNCTTSEAFGDTSSSSESGWVDVGVGAGFTCGLRGNGSITCWGFSPPQALNGTRPGPYVELEVGSYVVCLRTADGAVECFVDDAYAPTWYPTNITEPLRSIHLIDDLALFGLTEAGMVLSVDAAYQWDAGPLLALAPFGFMQLCGILATDGSLACAPFDDPNGCLSDPAEAPPGPFTAVEAECGYTCVADLDGIYRCFGRHAKLGDCAPLEPPTDTTRVDLGGHFCFLDAVGRAHCFQPATKQPTYAPAVDGFVTIRGGENQCGVRNDGHIWCWELGSMGDSTSYGYLPMP